MLYRILNDVLELDDSPPGKKRVQQIPPCLVILRLKEAERRVISTKTAVEFWFLGESGVWRINRKVSRWSTEM